MGLTFIALISSWSLLFRAIKLAKVPRMPLNESIEDLIKNHDFPNIYYALTKSCKKALNENKIVIDEKGALINKAYKDISISAGLIAADSVLILSSKLI